MSSNKIALGVTQHRLANHLIAGEKFEQPGQAVAWLSAMQAQDYAHAKWAVGLRCRNATDSTVEQAIANKSIIRTWLMRGTLHFVEASDARWMLALFAPRVIANSKHRYRQLELDETTFSRSFNTLATILQGSKQLTRAEVLAELEQAGIATNGQRGYHILQRAALDGLICFGPFQGKQQTFVLLDEWISPGKKMNRDEALAELAGRYFTSHGPATLQDFVWWSGLRVTEARTGLESAKSKLCQETIGGETYWLPENNSIAKEPSPTVYLLPAFDEYFLGYRDRSAVLDANYDKQVVSSNGIFRSMLVIDGQVVGIWKRTLKKDSVVITPSPFNPLTKTETQSLHTAANRYGEFLGLSPLLVF